MNRKNQIRAGLSFGIIMAIFNILMDFFISENHTTKQLIKSIIAGLIGGAVAGLLFGWLIGLFAKSKFVTRATKIETEPGENILFETPANHFKGIEGVGGKLYLTNKRLVFKSHKLNIQQHQLSLLTKNIKSFNRYKTLGLVDNGLAIIIAEGKTEKFVVEQVEIWIKFLTDANSLTGTGEI